MTGVDVESQVPFAVPVVDLAPWVRPEAYDDDARAEVARQLDRACREVGFVQVRGHGVPDAAVAGLACRAARDDLHGSAPLGVVRRDPARRRARDLTGDLPAEVHRVEQPGVHPLPTRRGHHVGGVPGQQATPGPVARRAADRRREGGRELEVLDVHGRAWPALGDRGPEEGKVR